MTPEEYLEAVLVAQTLEEDGTELKELRAHRDKVKEILESAFSPKPVIRYGGSLIKKTMILDSYDLDMTSYFPHTDERSLKQIFEEAGTALQKDYYVQPKTSALRLQSKRPESLHRDVRVDVVPGRFFDDTATDTWLYQASADKERLKTNLQVHIEHVRNSGVREAIRLMKLWRFRNGLTLTLKTFVLDLLVIDLLKSKTSASLPDQLRHVWTVFRDDSKSLSVKDPANPEGNDLSVILNPVRPMLSIMATNTLCALDNSGWESIFGTVEDPSKKVDALRAAAAVITTPTKPWSSGLE